MEPATAPRATSGDGATVPRSESGAVVSTTPKPTTGDHSAAHGAGGSDVAPAAAGRAAKVAADAEVRPRYSTRSLPTPVAAPAPAAPEDNPFNELFEKELEVVSDRLRGMNMDAMLQAGMKAAMGNDAEVKALQALQIARSSDRHRKLLERLWVYYEADRNGILNRVENRRLVADYIDASRYYTPKVVEATMRAGVQIGLKMAGTMAGQDLPPHVLSEVNAHVASLRPQIQQVALQVLDGVNVSAVADRALESMDENCDGKVTRDEFLGSFISVMTDMFDPQLIIAKIQQAMGMDG